MPNYVELERGFLEKLAEAAHQVFCDGLKAKGYRCRARNQRRAKEA